jgi:hypothetical protein
VTTIERTIVDCARTMLFADALAIADSALRQSLVDSKVLMRLAEGVRGPGAPAVRRALLAKD